VWFEVLSCVHFMAMLTLSEADSLMIPRDHSDSGFRVVSAGFVPIYKLFKHLNTLLMLHIFKKIQVPH